MKMNRLYRNRLAFESNNRQKWETKLDKYLVTITQKIQR